MSGKERDVLEVLGRVKRKELTVVAAADVVGKSLRQMRRRWKRFKAEGAAGLVHRARGRASNNGTPAELADRIVKRHQERYADFGPTLACEKLTEDGLAIGPDTLTALLKVRGLWRPMRKRSKHRKRRARRSSFGMMVQMDGSHHDWFEGRAARCVLMVIIDDASNVTFARFYASEDLAAAFDVFERWCRTHGIPRSVYVDRHSIYRDEDHPEKPTQFGRAMAELGVRLIRAHSPQAKGRVERRNRVFQDRLVKELRLRKIRDMAAANALLEEKFLKELNDRYAIEPRRGTDAHRLAERNLDEVLCVREERSVGNDWCVRWRNGWLQIAATHAPLSLAQRKVQVREKRDGVLLLSYQGRPLTWTRVAMRPRARAVIVNNKSWKPSATHPWVKRPALQEAGKG
ncbi:MAG: ISNCY family transposase, partial [Tepidisphaeraceae bacterium]